MLTGSFILHLRKARQFFGTPVQIEAKPGQTFFLPFSPNKSTVIKAIRIIVVVFHEKITLSYEIMKQSRNEVSDQELKRVIADFLDQGHVENIVAMFRREPKYYGWVGEILRDERFSVRLGVAVLFEELQKIQPGKLMLAIPSLVKLLHTKEPLLRGEAVSILGIIGTTEALAQIRHLESDSSPQVREMVQLVLEGCP
jgi:hypothetical protein